MKDDLLSLAIGLPIAAFATFLLGCVGLWVGVPWPVAPIAGILILITVSVLAAYILGGFGLIAFHTGKSVRQLWSTSNKTHPTPKGGEVQ